MPNYQPQLDWIDTQYDQMVGLVERWAGINSGSMNIDGINAMRQVLEGAFSILEGDTQTIPMPPLLTINNNGETTEQPIADALRIIKRPDAPIKVLLVGHMDTVFAVDHSFQTPRYIDNNTMNGPGVADLKGGLVVMLKALQALEKSPFAEKIGWEIILNPDEEIGSQSSNGLLVEAAGRNHIGLIYEPALADGTLAGQRKGSGNFTIIIRGKAAHAGREHHLGRNAIVALAEYTKALDALNGQREGVTINPGVITGGGATNIVPDLAILKFNTRFEKPEDQQWLEQQFKAIEKDFSNREGYVIERHGKFTRPPKILSDANVALFEAVKECGETLDIQVEWQATGGCCDGNNLAAAGLPNVDTMGVRGGNIHSAEEFILLDSLTERAKLSALLLMRLANGEIVIR